MTDQTPETIAIEPDYHVGMLFLVATSRRQMIAAIEKLLDEMRAEPEFPAGKINTYIRGFSTTVPATIQAQTFGHITQHLMTEVERLYRGSEFLLGPDDDAPSGTPEEQP